MPTPTVPPTAAQPIDDSGYPPDVTAGEERIAYTVREVAQALGRSTTWVHEMIAQGVLPSARVGGSRLILRDDLLNALRSRRTPAARR